MMNQPIAFSWTKEAKEAALKAGSGAVIYETGAYEADIVSAVYEFGKDGSQSQTLLLSLDADGKKANFVRINFIGRDGNQNYGMSTIAALMWAANVKDLRPQQRNGQDGTEWFLPDLEGKRAGFFLQKVLTTKTNGSDSYKFEVRHIFQPGTRLTYKEYSEKTAAETIANLERTVKDKDDRRAHDQNRGGWGAPNTQNSGGWGAPQNDPNAVPDSRLQQAMRQQNQTPEFDDDIPF